MELKKGYIIKLKGCSADTEIEIFLTQQEYELVARLEYLSEVKSTYGYIPTLTIEELPPIEWEE